MKNPTMKSLVKAYLEERRCLGFSLDIAGSQLSAFAKFADTADHKGPLSRDIIIKWAKSTSHATALTPARRVEVIRPFAKYCARINPAAHIPERHIFGPAHRRLAPHIYTDREIEDLLAAAADLPPTKSLRSSAYMTFFGLIAATGLRFSEAFNLRCSDFDCGRGLLTIRQTKFRKDRLVPLHRTVVEAVNRYVTLRQRKLGTAAEEWLFVTDTGQRPADRTVHAVFERLRKQLGWKARGGHPAPRMHDLRHTFVCRRVKLWQANGPDIDNVMPVLSTYLGHAKVSDTYWYLTATPDLMSAAVKRFERFARVVEEGRHA